MYGGLPLYDSDEEVTFPQVQRETGKNDKGNTGNLQEGQYRLMEDENLNLNVDDQEIQNQNADGDGNVQEVLNENPDANDGDQGENAEEAENEVESDEEIADEDPNNGENIHQVVNEIIEEINNMADLRQNDFLPKPFTGGKDSNPRSHFLSYEDYCNIHELGDAAKMARFKLTLRGEARQWLEGKQFQNFQEMKNQFIRYFTGAHTQMGTTAQFRQAKYRPGETIEKYGERIRSLANEGGIGEQMQVSQFLLGLPPQLRKALSASGLANLNALITRAQHMIDLDFEGDNQQSSHFLKEVSFFTEDESTKSESLGHKLIERTDQITAEIGALSTQLENISVKVDKDNINGRERKSNFSRQRSRSPAPVYKAQQNPRNGQNRQRNQNFNRPAYRRGHNPNIICFGCGRKGHIRSQCRAQIYQNRGFPGYPEWSRDHLSSLPVGKYEQESMVNRPHFH